MEPIIFTQLSIPKLRALFRQELESYFEVHPVSKINSRSDDIMTVDKTAKFLGLSVATIYSKVSQRELPVMKRGKRLYFSREELKGYLKEGRKKTNTEIEIEANKYLNTRIQK